MRDFYFNCVSWQAFTTDHDSALEDLYSKSAENSRQFEATLNTMATRIATVFASMKVRVI